MIALVVFILKKTSLGLFIQSVGINPTASRYAGINVALIIFLVYAFSGFCAGVSGLIESSLIRAAMRIMLIKYGNGCYFSSSFRWYIIEWW